MTNLVRSSSLSLSLSLSRPRYTGIGSSVLFPLPLSEKKKR